MTQPRLHAFAVRPAPARLLSLFILLAFVLQGLVIQTHLHAAMPTGGHHVSGPASPRHQDPLDPTHCPLCQEILHAGAAVTPEPPQIPLMLGWTATAPLGMAIIVPLLSLRHGWQSRAPPQA